MEYASLRRNPEALLLYQQHSTFLKQQRKRATSPYPAPSPHDPLLAYKKVDLVARVRRTEELLRSQEKQQNTLLQDYVQKDIKIAELEADLARHRQYLEGLRLTIQRQEEHQGNVIPDKSSG